MFDLQTFGLKDMIECGAGLRRATDQAANFEAAAQRIVGYLRDTLRDAKTGEKSTVLVRLYKTHRYAELDESSRSFTRELAGAHPLPEDLWCLVLLATVGDRPEWNTRQRSKGHQAIPLLSEAMVRSVPMVSRLFVQFGVEIGQVLAPDPEFLHAANQRTFNVFHVARALDSPYIPAQAEFVVPCGVQSVLGFGGILPSGSLFAVILFARVPIPESTADQFKTLALNARLALLPFDGGAVFDVAASGGRATGSP